MTEPRSLPENWAAPASVLTESPEAPHSWDPSGRHVPSAKLDWMECLPFRQVRGLEMPPGPERLPRGRGPGEKPE